MPWKLSRKGWQEATNSRQVRGMTLSTFFFFEREVCGVIGSARKGTWRPLTAATVIMKLTMLKWVNDRQFGYMAWSFGHVALLVERRRSYSNLTFDLENSCKFEATCCAVLCVLRSLDYESAPFFYHAEKVFQGDFNKQKQLLYPFIPRPISPFLSDVGNWSKLKLTSSPILHSLFLN